MNRVLFAMSFAVLCAGVAIAEPLRPAEIPEGVVYHRGPDERLESAKARLEAAFSKAGDDSERISPFGDGVICGPVLWSELRDVLELESLQTVPVQFNIPMGNGQLQQLEGRAFRGPSTDVLDGLVRERCTGDRPPRVEAPDKHDLSLYWALIPYEIEEPVFVLACGETRWFLDLDEDLNILWIDDFTDSARIVGGNSKQR